MGALEGPNGLIVPSRKVSHRVSSIGRLDRLSLDDLILGRPYLLAAVELKETPSNTRTWQTSVRDLLRGFEGGSALPRASREGFRYTEADCAKSKAGHRLNSPHWANP